MEERRGMIQWVKAHKKELVIAGISTDTLILIILGVKNRSSIMALWDSLWNVAKQPTVKVPEMVTKAAVNIPQEPIKDAVAAVASNSDSIPFEVSRHIRNLPDGWHASPEKMAEALKNHIILVDGQTWVESYMKGGVAA